MKRKTIIYAICAIAATVVALVVIGACTGVLSGTVFPVLKKAVMAISLRLWWRLLFQLLVLTGVMGYLSWLKEWFLNGGIGYDIEKGYSLIVGYDFQTRALIKQLLSENGPSKKGWVRRKISYCVTLMKSLGKLLGFAPDNCVLVITDRDVRRIREDMDTELTEEEKSRLLFMRRDLAKAETYADLRIRGAKAIYMMGDEETPCRDGVVLQASKVIAEKACAEKTAENGTSGKNARGGTSKSKDTPFSRVKVYLHFDNPDFYSQMRSKRLPMDPETKKDEKGKDTGEVDQNTVLFDLEVFNYYDSWVWKCWSEKDSSDGGDPYVPIRFKRDAERVELFVIGSGRAMKAVVDSAIALMNYGDDTRHGRLTVVSDRISEILPPGEVVASLPELEVVGFATHDFNREVAGKIVAAAADETCAVTVAIVEDAPDKSMETYLRLPFALRTKGISALLWMETPTRNLAEKPLIQVCGDKTQLRYFGMTDCLPWLGSDRQKFGTAVEYYYNDCYDDQRLPKGTDMSLLSKARAIWDEEKANQRWAATGRWKKWSSICCAGSFKEKVAILGGCAMTPDRQLRLLKAEHDRWWAERLLGDWRLGANVAGKKDEKRRLHPNLVPFGELDDFNQDIDKLCIAAMAQQGFLTET